ncbi:Radical SAM domain protein [Pyrolobus fumarii 1A]|uniref:Radical SAM domain protein n=1 Tax=Pyrolobus fumarii (strain DSM 11204 / 1A) TaxID=694429 RepID=G0EC59_PYRF1|nr:radical SAM protein [Pyrolobus fumarii]AEM39429.1 Radical SAM domain protein [Pyrolobus fumarii 1A]
MTRKSGLVIRSFDPWSSPLCTCPPKYSLQPYTGCSHFCRYCYATAYIGMKKSTPKQRLLERLEYDLKRFVNPCLTINMSTSSDPYPPEERVYRLTRRVLEFLVPRGYRILITTKSSLVARDADVLARGNTAVTITITTLDDELARKLEPGAPSPRERIEAIRRLHEYGVPVGIRLDPLLPHLNDDEESIREVLEAAHDAGARFVVTSTYKARPDNLKRVIETFPELRDLYERMYKRDGTWMHGYWYLPANKRLEMIMRVKRIADKLGLEFATCREGFKHLHTAPSCDGSHLIPNRVPLPRGSRCSGNALSSKLGVERASIGLRRHMHGSERT